jgi:hypothetical protein
MSNRHARAACVFIVQRSYLRNRLGDAAVGLATHRRSQPGLQRHDCSQDSMATDCSRPLRRHALSCVHDAHKAARVAALSSTDKILWRIRSAAPNVGPSLPNSDISIRGVWSSPRRAARICKGTDGNIEPTEPPMMIRSGLSNLTTRDKPRTIHSLQSCGVRTAAAPQRRFVGGHRLCLEIGARVRFRCVSAFSARSDAAVHRRRKVEARDKIADQVIRSSASVQDARSFALRRAPPPRTDG